MSITYNDHAAGALPDGSEVIPGWQASGAKKFPIKTFKRLLVNASNVSAAGTNQTGATPISNSFDLHIVTTVGSGAGTKFTGLASAAEVGQIMVIVCDEGAANALLHYPASGGKINGLAVNAPVTIAVGNAAMFVATSTVNWRSIP